MNKSEKLRLIFQLLRYNMKIIFSGRFMYFVLAAWIFYLTLAGLMLFSDSASEISDIYNVLLFPGILVMFYPVVFNIQNDKDNRMLEIIFGVPDYRYKVYLLRFILTLLLMVVILLFMAWFAWFALIKIPVIAMILQLVYPLFFLASLTFLFTTLFKNGNGAAVVTVIIGLANFLFFDVLRKSKWNIFLNPFYTPQDMNLSVWLNIIRQNRLILIIGALIALLWGLRNLQQREKFIK